MDNGAAKRKPGVAGVSCRMTVDYELAWSTKTFLSSRIQHPSNRSRESSHRTVSTPCSCRFDFRHSSKPGNAGAQSPRYFSFWRQFTHARASPFSCSSIEIFSCFFFLQSKEFARGRRLLHQSRNGYGIVESRITKGRCREMSGSNTPY